jgi:hypothetical protein
MFTLCDIIRKKCAACMESVTKNDPHTPCGHAYCIGCLQELFKASMQDETLMPPQCCRQEIPIVLAKLTPKETDDFNAKRLEHLTTDRLYCSQPTCSTFIPPAFIVNSVGRCPKYVYKKFTLDFVSKLKKGGRL